MAAGMHMMGAMNNAMGGMGGPAAVPSQPPATPAAAPPPLPGASAAAWHVAIDGQQYGPYDNNTLKQYIDGGQVTRESMVWAEGMPGWQAAGEVSALAALFAPSPARRRYQVVTVPVAHRRCRRR